MAENAGSSPDFETALKRLEDIVRKLESGELSLDSALELFEEGIQLSRFCHTKLDAAERRVEILLKNNSGQLQAAPFAKPTASDQRVTSAEPAVSDDEG